MDEDSKLVVKDLFEKGSIDKLYEFLKPYIEKEDAFALNIFAGFSTPKLNETDEEFSDRYIRLKTLASDKGVAEASYQMGVNFLYGDDVPQSYAESSKYFERAIEQGHSYTKFTYGFSLYYGTNEVLKDECRGVQLMEEAARDGIEEAKKELKIINAKNT